MSKTSLSLPQVSAGHPTDVASVASTFSFAAPRSGFWLVFPPTRDVPRTLFPVQLRAKSSRKTPKIALFLRHSGPCFRLQQRTTHESIRGYVKCCGSHFCKGPNTRTLLFCQLSKQYSKTRTPTGPLAAGEKPVKPERRTTFRDPPSRTVQNFREIPPVETLNLAHNAKKRSETGKF